ncbi:MAG: hypothetical protein F6K19_46835, partial [Cyanothece sp. SIO1E1]|nr:hypothetical protein [Cyanothece sp. SIO1E1]
MAGNSNFFDSCDFDRAWCQARTRELSGTLQNPRAVEPDVIESDQAAVERRSART